MRRRMMWTIRLSAAVIATGSLLAGAAASGAASQPPRPTAVVDWSAERQTVDGFGGAFVFHKAVQSSGSGSRSARRCST